MKKSYKITNVKMTERSMASDIIVKLNKLSGNAAVEDMFTFASNARIKFCGFISKEGKGHAVITFEVKGSNGRYEYVDKRIIKGENLSIFRYNLCAFFKKILSFKGWSCPDNKSYFFPIYEVSEITYDDVQAMASTKVYEKLIDCGFTPNDIATMELDERGTNLICKAENELYKEGIDTWAVVDYDVCWGYVTEIAESEK